MNKEIKTDIKFQEKYKELSDSEIQEILKQRNEYQEAAAIAAIEEAIKRGIIHSGQDLYSEEYRIEQNHKNKFFPSIKKEAQREKILTSIQRVNYIIGFIFLLFAGLNYTNKNLTSFIVFTFIGMSWIFLNYKQFKSKSRKTINLMILELIFAIGYSSFLTLNMKSPQLMDFTVATVLFLISLYMLLLARSIHQK